MSPIGSLSKLPLPLVPASSGGLPRETVFEILRNTRRRYVFHYLRQSGESVSLADLSEAVAAFEYDTSVDALEPAQRQRVYVSLRQTHLPRMDEANVIEFDPDANTVALDENATDLQVYLEAVPDDDILWAQYYLGVAGMGAGLLLLLWLNVPPFSSYPAVLGVVFLTVLGLSAVLHHRHLERRRLGEGESPI